MKPGKEKERMWMWGGAGQGGGWDFLSGGGGLDFPVLRKHAAPERSSFLPVSINFLSK